MRQATLLTLHLCLICRAEGYRVVLVNSNPVCHVEHMLCVLNGS